MIDIPKLRADMVEIAQNEEASAVETGSEPEGNEGPDVERYLNGGQRPGVIKYKNLRFCCGAYQWVLQQALARQDLKLPWHYTLGADVLARFFDERPIGAVSGYMRGVGLPTGPGDAVFWYAKGSRQINHIDMVLRMEPEVLAQPTDPFKIITLGANEQIFKAPAGPAWTRRTREPSDLKRLAGYGTLACLANL